MANTMSLIQTLTVGSGGTSSLTFSSIPASYTDLVLTVSARTNRGSLIDDIVIKLNSSTSNYGEVNLYAYGTPQTGTSTSLYINCDGDTATANTFGSASMYICGYASNKYKSITTDWAQEYNGTSAILGFQAQTWSNTGTITSIVLTPDAGTSILQYSSFSLYGVTTS